MIKCASKVFEGGQLRRHDIQHNDTHHNDTLHTQHNNKNETTQRNGFICDTQHKGHSA